MQHLPVFPSVPVAKARLQEEFDLHPQLDPRGLHVTWGAGAGSGLASAAADTEGKDTKTSATATAKLMNFIAERDNEKSRRVLRFFRREA